MDLYFSPLACSMATRIALYEAGAEAELSRSRSADQAVLNDGSDFRTVNPLGLVPTLRTDDGVVLTENAAILQYVADRFPQSGLGAGEPASSARGCINGSASSAPSCTRACSCRCSTSKAPQEHEGLCAGEEPVAARLSRQLSQGSRIPARPFQRRGRLSRHGDQLDHGDAADRARQMAEREGLLRAPAAAAVDREGDRAKSSSCTRPSRRGRRRRRKARPSMATSRPSGPGRCAALPRVSVNRNRIVGRHEAAFDVVVDRSRRALVGGADAAAARRQHHQPVARRHG